MDLFGKLYVQKHFHHLATKYSFFFFFFNQICDKVIWQNEANYIEGPSWMQLWLAAQRLYFMFNLLWHWTRLLSQLWVCAQGGFSQHWREQEGKKKKRREKKITKVTQLTVKPERHHMATPTCRPVMPSTSVWFFFFFKPKILMFSILYFTNNKTKTRTKNRVSVNNWGIGCLWTSWQIGGVRSIWHCDINRRVSKYTAWKHRNGRHFWRSNVVWATGGERAGQEAVRREPRQPSTSFNHS